MNVVSVIMIAFALLGAADYLLNNKFGLGKGFEKGFSMLGTLSLSMIGMIVLAPTIAQVLTPVLNFISQHTPFDPSIIAGSLLANDMGGASLAMRMANDAELGYFNGLVVSCMMGAAISFNLPFIMSAAKKDQLSHVLLGMLCGIIAVPVGCFVSGLMLGLGVGKTLLNLLPLTVFAVIIALGLWFVPKIALKIFSVFGKVLRLMIIAGLMAGIIEFLLGVKLIPHSAPLEEGILIVFNAGAVMAGAFPLLYLLQKALKKPLKGLAKMLKINDSSALGFVSTLATNVTTFSMLDQMDERGIVFNSAFAVSASFLLSDHLAFTLSFKADYLPAVMAGKVISAIAGIAVAMLLYSMQKKKKKVN